MKKAVCLVLVYLFIVISVLSDLSEAYAEGNNFSIISITPSNWTEYFSVERYDHYKTTLLDEFSNDSDALTKIFSGLDSMIMPPTIEMVYRLVLKDAYRERLAPGTSYLSFTFSYQQCFGEFYADTTKKIFQDNGDYQASLSGETNISIALTSPYQEESDDNVIVSTINTLTQVKEAGKCLGFVYNDFRATKVSGTLSLISERSSIPPMPKSSGIYTPPVSAEENSMQSSIPYNNTEKYVANTKNDALIKEIELSTPGTKSTIRYEYQYKEEKLFGAVVGPRVNSLNGYTSKEITYSDTGSVTREKVFCGNSVLCIKEYNSNGYLVELRFPGGEGNSQSFLYFENGELLLEEFRENSGVIDKLFYTRPGTDLSITVVRGQTAYFTYNRNNQLIQVLIKDESGKQIDRYYYAYDVFGIRYQIETYDGEISASYDMNGMLAELTYTWFVSYRDANVSTKKVFEYDDSGHFNKIRTIENGYEYERLEEQFAFANTGYQISGQRKSYVEYGVDGRTSAAQFFPREREEFSYEGSRLSEYRSRLAGSLWYEWVITYNEYNEPAPMSTLKPSPSSENPKITNPDASFYPEDRTLVDNFQVTVFVKDAAMTVVIKNLDLKDSYQVKKVGTEDSFGFAYVWEIVFSDGIYQYWLGTQIEDYIDGTVSLDGLEGKLFRSDTEGKTFTEQGKIKMTREGNSLRWTLTPKLTKEISDISGIQKIRVNVRGQGIESIDVTYPVLENNSLDQQSDLFISSLSVGDSYSGKSDSVYVYAFERFCSDNREEARLLFEVSAKRGDARAQFMLGAYYADYYTAEEAKDFLELSAAQQYAPAIYELGVFYEQGTGVKKDMEQANRLFTQAATMLYKEKDTEDAEVARTVARCYYYGDSPYQKDLAKARDWFAKSARLGNPAAALRAGKMIFNGEIEGSTEEMFNWFVQAMNGGEAGGYFYCAVMILAGDASGDIDALMQEAAERGYSPAKVYLNSGTLLLVN